MERRAYQIFSNADREVYIKVIPGHFATKHSHVNYCVDMTEIKSSIVAGKAAARLFANAFSSTPVDTIISLDRMKLVGAFLADFLTKTHINYNQNIAVITPEITQDKMLLRDNFLPYIKNKNVLLLTASATTGKNIRSTVEGIEYYGGVPAGVATVFSGDIDCRVPLVRIFSASDIPDYSSYAPTECPLCRSGVRIDAVVNSYGYSKII